MLKQGMFYPELTMGAGGISDGRKSEISDFLSALLRYRHFPLHLANLWNALYFNYDLDYRGFRSDHLEQKRIPTRTAAARDSSLPVGGFLRVHTETGAGDLLGEVVYKEGAHPLLGSGWVSPSVSGSPADVSVDSDGEGKLVVRERFVLDLAAFGPDGNSVTPVQYERICRHARWLDEHGHLLMEAIYGSEEAGQEDLDYYIDYLLREHREGLLSFCFSEELDDSELREALLRSLEAVREIALSCRTLRNWRGKYFFSAEDYEQRLAGDGPLGSGDLRAIYTGLTRTPQTGLGYSAISERILELLERHGVTSEEESLVRGCSYSTAICHANLYVAETLSSEQASGILPSGVHLRLDDDWQAGGIWRAEMVSDVDRYSLGKVPPTIPLALGFMESSREEEAAVEIVGHEEEPMPSSQTGFRVSVTLRDRALGRLRLPPQAMAALANGPIEVVLKWEEVRETFAVERKGDSLWGVVFPWGFHPGIILSCNVESRGSIVRCRATRVSPPFVATDGNSFDYETNVSVYESQFRLGGLTRDEERGAPSIRELCNRAFRQRGRPVDGGGRALTLSEIATILLGPSWRLIETRPLAVALSAMGLERAGPDYVWRQRVGGRTTAADRSLLGAYGEAAPRGRISRSVHHHWVPMHLRLFSEASHRSPSTEKQATYAQARIEHRMFGVLPEELPAAYTWVKPFERGSENDPEPSEDQEWTGAL